MYCVWWHSGDVCDLSPTLCKYKLLMCGGGVRSILLLPIVAICIETIDVCFVVCWYGCIYFLAALVHVCVDVMVMSSVKDMT